MGALMDHLPGDWRRRDDLALATSLYVHRACLFLQRCRRPLGFDLELIPSGVAKCLLVFLVALQERPNTSRERMRVDCAPRRLSCVLSDRETTPLLSVLLSTESECF